MSHFSVPLRARVRMAWQDPQRRPGFRRAALAGIISVLMIVGAVSWRAGLRPSDINVSWPGSEQAEHSSADEIDRAVKDDNPSFANETPLSDLQVGASAYTVAWAMWLDTDGTYWLHPDYPAFVDTAGTIEMRVERHEDGYHVWVPPGEIYEKQAEPIGSEGVQYIRVAEVHD